MGKCAEASAALYHASVLDPTDETTNAIFGSILDKCKEEENKTK